MCRWGVCCLIKGRGAAGWRLRLRQRVRVRSGEEVAHHFSDWCDQSQAGVLALEQEKDKGKPTSEGLAVLRSGGECCHGQGMQGISQGKEK